MRKFTLWILSLITLGACALNLWWFPRPNPITIGSAEFNINQLVESNRWDESAPIVLANHFRRVEVKRVGNPKKYGISFSRELARVFEIKGVNHLPPITLRDPEAMGKLHRYVQYWSDTGCAVKKKITSCRLLLIWDDTNSSPYRTFVTFYVSDQVFALVDSNLVKNVIGVTSW